MGDVGRARISSTDTSVHDLVEEVRRREEAARSHARELADLRQEALAAINQEAAHLVATARSEIRAIIVNSRNRLTELRAQHDAINGAQRTLDSFPSEAETAADPESTSGPDVGESAATQERLIDVRRSLHQMLDEARPELKGLHQQALALTERDVVKVMSHRPVVRTEPAPAAQPVPVVEWRAPIVPLPELQLRVDSSRKRGGKWFAAIGGLAAIGALLLVTWWGTRSPAPTSAAPPTAAPIPAAPTSSERPSVKALSPPQAAAAPATVSPWSLRLETRGPVWIQTTVDGRSETGRMFQAGERRTIEASRDVSVRVGNAGAVLVSIRGGEPKALGRDGEVVTRRFAVSDASPAASPRATSPATVSEKPGSDAVRGSSVKPQQDPGDGPGAPPRPTAAATTGSGGPRETIRPAAPRDPGESAASEVTTAAQQWLDGYYRRDAGLMAAVATQDVKISDDRSNAERLPPGLNVRRTLDRVTTQLVGETAILSGRVTDQADVDGQVRQSVSWISLVWMREAGVWRVTGVRIINDAKLTNMK